MKKGKKSARSRSIFSPAVLGVPVLSALILLVALCCGPADRQPALKIGDAFPKFSLAGLDGARLLLPDAAAGKVAAIHFWASWCPLCVQEMNAMEELMAAYGAKGVVFYSINSGDSAEAARAYVKRTRATYPVLLDPKMEVTKRCGVNGIPTTFVCDRNGIIRFKVLGEISKAQLETLLSKLFQ